MDAIDAQHTPSVTATLACGQLVRATKATKASGRIVKGLIRRHQYATFAEGMAGDQTQTPGRGTRATSSQRRQPSRITAPEDVGLQRCE